MPGRALRALVLNKLPFKVPSEPLTAARLERLAEEGEDGFMDYLLPHAALKLKQGFGRLIRSRRDVGVVVLLDSRVVTKRYGPLLLGGLPRAERVIGTLGAGADQVRGLLRPARHRSHRMTPVCARRRSSASAATTWPTRRSWATRCRRCRCIFLKPPSALIGPVTRSCCRGVSQQVEFEAEIGVVIGPRARGTSAGGGGAGIGGFTCVNDVTCRDLQKTDGQWGRAKGFDTFCPVGPRVVQGLDWRDARGHLPGERRGASARPRDRHALSDSATWCRSSAAS